jgi:allantoinase
LAPLTKWEAPLDLVVAGNAVLADGTTTPGEIGVRAGRIVAIAERGCLRGKEHLDFGTALVLPGHVDAHVHSHSEPGDGVCRTTAAAAAGGATTIVDVPSDGGPRVGTAAAVRRRTEQIETGAMVDMAMFAPLPQAGDLDEIVAMMDAGVAGFTLGRLGTYEGLRSLAAVDALAAIHPDRGAHAAALAHPYNGWHATPPVAAETETIGRMLELALATGAHVHLCHVSVPRGFELVARARADGADVTAETSTPYLFLDARDALRDPTVRSAPPLRTPMDREALWDLLGSGMIDMVTSDHVGCERRADGDDSLGDEPTGFPGVQLTLALMFSEGVVARDVPLARLLKVLCENPARRLGLWPRKGAIAIGADADLVVLDPGARWRVDESRLWSAAGWSPYHGREVVGRIQAVFVRGSQVVRGGGVVGQPGLGRPIGERAAPRALHA